MSKICDYGGVYVILPDNVYKLGLRIKNFQYFPATDHVLSMVRGFFYFLVDQNIPKKILKKEFATRIVEIATRIVAEVGWRRIGKVEN